MMKAWYTTGTIAVVQGTKTIVGTGTAWKQDINGIGRGHALIISTATGDRIYEIDRVDDDTHIITVQNVKEATASGLSYGIVNFMPSTLPDFGRKLSVQLSDYQTFFDSFQQLATGTGDVTLTAPDGQTVTVRSQKAWDDALNGKVTGVKQTDPFDATAGSLLINGAWGWGGLGQTFNSDDAALLVSARNAAFGSRVFRNNTVSAYSKQYAPSLMLKTGDTWAIVSVGYTVSGVSGGIRIAAGTNSGSATTVHELWTDRNLTKQASSTDATVGSVLVLNGDTGSFGLGGTAVRMPADADVAAYLRTVPSGKYAILPNASASNLPIPGSLSGWTFDTSRFNANPLISVVARITDASGAIFHGLISGTGVSWFRVWDSANLIKQTGPFDATAGSLLINGAWGWGGKGLQRIFANEAEQIAFMNSAENGSQVFRPSVFSGGAESTLLKTYAPAILFKSEDTWAAISVGHHAPSSTVAQRKGVKIVAGTQGGPIPVSYELWTDKNLPNPATLDTAQTISAIKTFAAVPVVQTASYPGIWFESTSIDSSTVGRKTVIEVNSTGTVFTFIGRNGTNSTGQRVASLVLPVAGDPGEVILSSGAQTIAGVKIFSEKARVSRNAPGLIFEKTDIASGTLGRFLELDYEGPNVALLKRITQGSGTGQQSIRFPFPSGTAAGAFTGLVQGINAVADSNGFWKTASPVVKLFADGTSELTSEAEGVTTERLSEGVYRISGCLGLNADLAWGGIEGGISCPKCRNGLERIWNDYGVESDGSIIIRTYHRPHPDAPPFARNEIEGYANGDPIDIPRDTFISVRVQMPEREESKPKVMHSNVYCNTAAG
ncbi:hypothetical protein [Candidatus Symbiopectobacterium sp. NZEC135]|uniref:phage tail fiber protein n=1 Tax=Candidatus Symbiopectobacterium sp. NZEC135 TaxID=2820471 RepID=UPI0022279A3D|nr:hypothetical protein [Candidatus Symbiopectobacterium sp. NZEC135]MCW2479733.1 hypothetical protein [Candidatus Symbiopectobacterium sp. NZEC135]